MPSITKDRISSPLEAGPSLLDVKQLPPQLTSALDYVSSRLSRKRLHLSLIVIRKDVQLPISPPASPPLPTTTSSSTTNSNSTSPARSLFGRQLSKHSSNGSLSSSSSSSTGFSRTIYPSLPNSPKPSLTSTSPVSSTSSESSLSPCTSPEPPNPYGISLLHATTLTPKAEKILRQTIGKAEKKFGIGSGWLSSQPLSTSSRCQQTNDLIRRSLLQNETLFSSSGLTLYALDHIYVFKNYLHNYSRMLSAETLTTAVDELRRLVLTQPNHASISKPQLMKAYPWLGISLAALVDVNEGYKKTYGGATRNSGVDVSPPASPSASPAALPLSLQTNFALGLSLQMIQRPQPRRPKLSLALNVDTAKADEIRFGESARGVELDGADDNGPAAAARLSPTLRAFREDRGPHRRGPQTPNGFEDITPVTKGEWCYLMVGEGWKGGRTVAVETC
ncbi:hypothetical protein PVAG01_05347 [Phlyctema vagabunda]|uniref:DUF7582 domain-containing protein n=1 Tax=Phlyctema vagabunda TaxID=108571 RepID=A0ABR4PJU2_9HELO